MNVSTITSWLALISCVITIFKFFDMRKKHKAESIRNEEKIKKQTALINLMQDNHITTMEKTIEKIEKWMHAKSMLIDEMDKKITTLMTACKIAGILNGK